MLQHKLNKNNNWKIHEYKSIFTKATICTDGWRVSWSGPLLQDQKCKKILGQIKPYIVYKTPVYMYDIVVPYLNASKC